MAKVVDVEGIIGAGKTTLVKRLTTEHDIEPVYEPVKDNPFLDKFYADPKRYALIIQMWLMARRHSANRAAFWLSRAGKNVAIDRGRLGDRCFAVVNHEVGNITDDEMQVYDEFYKNQHTHDPDIIVYLDITVDEALRRINHRNRECERKIYPDYLDMLRNQHDHMIDAAHSRGVEILVNPTIADVAAACGL